MRVALVGPPQSGKSTLFAAVAEAGGSHVDIHRPDQPHLAVVKVPDDRLTWLAEQDKPKKVTFAELEFLDLPGLAPGAAHALNPRQIIAHAARADALVVVVSEETGTISLAAEGALERFLTPEDLKKRLETHLDLLKAPEKEVSGEQTHKPSGI